MAAHDDDPVVEQLADLLARYDDALREGAPPPVVDLPPSAPELPARLRRAQACLRVLRGRWPGRPTDYAGGATARGPARSDLASPGAHLGRYAILRLLGRGGHGVVYLAWDPALRRQVALKVARPETFLDPDLHGRFRREAAAAAGLDHPNLVPVHERGEAGPWVYIVSAYCPGPSLAAWLREQRDPVPVATAAELVAALADGVAYMHGRGVLHRDIKPGNVLLQTGDGRSQVARRGPSPAARSVTGNRRSPIPRLTDFGLAKVTDGTRYRTQPGVVLGTPAYMSPEQAAGRVSDLGPATDTYALGVLLYELLTGRPPFRAETNVAVLRQVLHEEPAPPGRLRPGLPRDLESVCLECLEKKPEHRYPSAAALADDLRRFLSGQATRARPLTAWQRGWKGLVRRPRLAFAVSAGLLALVALLGVGWYVSGIRDSAATWSATADTASRERDRLARERDLLDAKANSDRQRSYAREFAMLGELADEGRLTTGQLAATGPAELRGFEWYYLRRLAHNDSAGTEWFVGRGHTQPVVRVAFSPDGQLCASAGLAGTVIVWDLATHRRRWLASHKQAANEVAFSPDGKTLAAALDGPELKLWDVASGRQRASFRVPAGPGVYGLAFAPDGQTLALCAHVRNGDAYQVLLWDLRSGRARGLASPEAAWYPALAFAADGHTLAVGGGNGHGPYPGNAAAPEWGGIQLFDTATGRRSARLTGHAAVVQWVAFTPDGKTLVSADVTGTVKVWDVSTGQARLSLRAGTHLAVSPDGTTLAAVRAGRDLHLWDVATGRWLARVGNVPSQVHCLRFGPSGTQLAVACDDRTVRLFDARNIHDLPGHRPAEAWAVAFAPDGKWLASAGDDHAIRLWSVPGFEQRRVLRGHTTLVASVAFSPDGRTLASGGFDHTVRLWDVATGRPKAVLRGHAQDIRVVAFSPDGRRLASAAKSVKQAVGELKLWDLPAGEQRTALAAAGNCLAFSRGGRLLAFRNGGGAVTFLDLSTLKPTQGVPGLASLNRVTFAPDGKTLVTTDAGGVVRFWDVEAGAERERLRARPGSEVRAMVFSPDGKTLASAGMDKTIVLWQAATGLELLRFKQLPAYAHALAFSPDGALLAAACHDGTVRVYQANLKD
jgi:WD40 repeat protein